MAIPSYSVALVGCGQIADAHLQEIKKVPGARVVAVCDRYRELAEQAAARFGVPGVYTDLGCMLAEARPAFVHVTTPPHTHAAVAGQALAAGAHVYIEKPFALDADEAEIILTAAEAAGRLVCVGHDQLFDPAWELCRRMHARGDLGQVVHVDSIQGYHLDGAFGRVLLDDPAHWVHRLPGGLFQNVISHALYRITEFLPDEHPAVWASWFGSKGVAGIPTELRVLLRGQDASATLLFTSAARPAQRVTRVLGTRGSIEVDLDARVVRRLRGPSLPGAFGKLDVPFRQATESVRHLLRNAWHFLRGDVHYFAGMNTLFRRFYAAAAAGSAPPIPYADIRRGQRPSPQELLAASLPMHGRDDGDVCPPQGLGRGRRDRRRRLRAGPPPLAHTLRHDHRPPQGAAGGPARAAVADRRQCPVHRTLDGEVMFDERVELIYHSGPALPHLEAARSSKPSPPGRRVSRAGSRSGWPSRCRAGRVGERMRRAGCRTAPPRAPRQDGHHLHVAVAVAIDDQEDGDRLALAPRRRRCERLRAKPAERPVPGVGAKGVRSGR